ncbi:MAG: S8 family serine peptidase [Chloroflexota bacterium]
MKNALVLTLVLLAAILFWTPAGLPASGAGDWTAGVTKAKSPTANSGEFVPGHVLVKFKPSVSPSSVSAVMARHGMKEKGRIADLGVQLMSVSPGQEAEVIAKLADNELVEYAEPDYLLRLLFLPDDPYYADQWNLKMIGMPAAWDISRGSASVKVAVIDTGTDLSHPDRPVNLVKGYNYVSQSYDASDSNGHGTFVSGIVAAATNNAIGDASVAPNVTLIAYKELDPDTGKFTAFAVSQAVKNATDIGAKVVNLSLGGPDFSATLQSATDYAWQKGALVVAAAGNCGPGSTDPYCTEVNEIEYPAANRNVLAVGSTTSGDIVAAASTQNSTVDTSAPGQSIPSLWSGGGYGTGSGTSFAAPHVAALAALLWSANPDLSNKQVGDAIVLTVKDLGPAGRDNAYGWGRIDAHAALAFAVATPTPTPTATTTPTSTPTPTSTATLTPTVSPSPTYTPTPTQPSAPSRLLLPLLYKASGQGGLR